MSHLGEAVTSRVLRTEPSRLPLLGELEFKLTERISEAQQRTWLGEGEGLRLRKREQHAGRLVHFGIAAIPQAPA